MFCEEMIGFTDGLKNMDYSWRDVVLYALAIGAREQDEQYTFEKQLKVLPTFASIPCFGVFGTNPYIPYPLAPSRFAAPYIEDTAGLQMDHDIVIHHPMNPMGEKLTYQTVINDIYDRGDKGGVINQKTVVYGASGTPICTNTFNNLYYSAGGFGGKEMPQSTIVIPNRAADKCDEAYIPTTQALLYRLTGDINYIHVDQKYAASRKLKKPIIQGLCTMGYACRMAIDSYIPYQPERVTHIGAQMRGVLYPGSTIILQMWQTSPGTIVFRVIDKESNNKILDRGIMEWI